MKASTRAPKTAPWTGEESGSVVLDELEARPAQPDELKRVAALLDDE